MKTVTELRAEFAKLRKAALYIASEAEWMEAVKALLPKDGNPTPEQWVEAARKARTKCHTCRNGRYSWGTCNNGVMSNFGPCFRCNGTGFQGHEDYKRNQYYDNHRRIF